ncbi:35003_t:CDS:2, partial [Racocetra persica]
ALKEKVEEKYLEMLEKAKEIALNTEIYNKNIEYNIKKATKTLSQEASLSDNKNVKITQLTEAFENLKLYYVMECLSNKLEKVKKIVNELTKMSRTSTCKEDRKRKKSIVEDCLRIEINSDHE